MLIKELDLDGQGAALISFYVSVLRCGRIVTGGGDVIVVLADSVFLVKLSKVVISSALKFNNYRDSS